MPGALCSLVVLIMSRAEIPSDAGCVPVSKAETPVMGRDLPSVQSDATGSGADYLSLPVTIHGQEEEPGTLRQRAERRLFHLEVMAELMAAELGPESPQGRLVACRYAAARSLFLGMLDTYQEKPSNWTSMGHPWQEMEERGLIGHLCRRFGWRVVRPGVLARKEAMPRG